MIGTDYPLVRMLLYLNDDKRADVQMMRLTTQANGRWHHKSPRLPTTSTVAISRLPSTQVAEEERERGNIENVFLHESKKRQACMNTFVSSIVRVERLRVILYTVTEWYKKSYAKWKKCLNKNYIYNRVHDVPKGHPDILWRALWRYSTTNVFWTGSGKFGSAGLLVQLLSKAIPRRFGRIFQNIARSMLQKGELHNYSESHFWSEVVTRDVLTQRRHTSTWNDKLWDFLLFFW